MSDLYTSTGLVEVTGASYRQIDYWTTRGWLVPLSIAGMSATGTGNHRVYPASEVAVARALLLSQDRAAVAKAARAEYEEAQS